MTNEEPSSEGQVDLGALRVLVARVHAYGNLGDELETAPLFHKLKEWGVGTVDAELSAFTHEICAAEEVSAPQIKGEPYLSDSFVRSIHDRMPTSRYDLVIIAPGPNVLRHTLVEAAACSDELILFGVSLAGENASRLLHESRKFIRGIVAREPISEDLAKRTMQSGGFFSKLKAWNREDTPVFMSADIGFSSLPYLDQELIASCRRKFDDELPKGFNLIFPRAYRKGEHASQVVLRENSESGNLELWTDEDAKLASFENDVVIATTDLPVDREMMQFSSNKFAQVPHISCERVEELLALVEAASSVYTTRYHPGVMALLMDTPLTILPHSGERTKMEGLKLVQQGLAKGAYEKNNDAAWHFLRSVLEEKARAL